MIEDLNYYAKAEYFSFHSFSTPVKISLTMWTGSHTIGTVSTSMCAPVSLPPEASATAVRLDPTLRGPAP